VRSSDVRSTLDSNVRKRTNKLLVELRTSGVRFLDRLWQPVLRQWDFWSLTHSLDAESSAYLVDERVLD
jgi:hypothetical protein